MPDPDAGHQVSALLPRVYDELRRLATAQLRDQPAGHTLQPTALVNEAWMKLAGHDEMRFESRGQFLVLASRAMRQVLVDHARGKRRAKRGGGWRRVSLAETAEPAGPADVDLLALEEALTELTALNEERARLVELRFFGGLTETEAADTLGISRREASRQWRALRAWLWTRLRNPDEEAPG